MNTARKTVTELKDQIEKLSQKMERKNEDGGPKV